jgi:transposase
LRHFARAGRERFLSMFCAQQALCLSLKNVDSQNASKMFINYSSLRDQYYDKVIDLYFHHHMSYRLIAEIIPVSRSGIAKWIRNFAGENLEVPIMRKRTVKQKRTIVEPEPRQELPDDVKALQAELLKVKEELRKERLRADAYDTMIDIAEDMFKVPIRKKAGAKR